MPNRKHFRTGRKITLRRDRRTIARTLKIARAHSRFSRRKFLHQTAGTSLLLSLAPHLLEGQTGNTEQQTLFFNLSRPEGLARDGAGNPARYFLTVGGRNYPLQPVSENPAVLARARAGNSFLQAVPEDQITHYLEDLVVSADITPLVYVWTPIDQQAGTWKMESVVQLLSPSAMAQAWTKVRALSPDEPVPLSAKREFYGLAAAFSEQDMIEELALVDYTDSARTLIALHPDMLCARPPGAAYISASYVSVNSNTTFLAATLRSLGPAAPQESPQQQNVQGWATLTPLKQNDGTPFKMENGFNQYFPDWNSTVDSRVGISLTALLPRVKNDTVLGSDITNLSPDSNAKITSAIEQQLTDKVWYRHDGTTAVDHGSEAFLKSALPEWDFHQKNGETGLEVRQPGIGRASDGRVQITFDNIANWFLRFLGVYFQFVDPYGSVIPKSQLPPDVLPDRNPSLGPILDRENALYAGVIPPVFSIAGIPVYPPGQFSMTVNLPTNAATVNAFYAGLGLSGSQYDPTRLRDIGLALTVTVNFAMVAFFMAVGVSTLSDTIKEIVEVVDIIAAQLLNALDTWFNSGSAVSKDFFLGVLLTVFETFLNSLAGRGAEKLLKIILTKMVAAQFLSAVPVAGQIARAAAAAIGALTLAVTLVEVGISPTIYQFDLSFTHDLSLTILPDPDRRTFPPVTGDEVLYYKINYLFNNGSPHFLDHVDVPDPSIMSIPITLKAIPWGGEVNISVGFYVRKKATKPSENDWCAGKGTTGLIPNTDQQPPDIVLKDFKIPIEPGTVYIHTSKTTLDLQGRHHWTSTSLAPPYVPPSSENKPGDVGAFRSITVRQATKSQKGYVGYAWQAYSLEIGSCETGARAQLDMAGNLNTDQGNNGANAQDGYTVTRCGLQGAASGGLKLSYNLLTDPSANFYLDTSSKMLRQVRLDPTPDFSDPLSGKSFGKLNLDSTMLLLHPAGHAVSINNANSKLEALHLPASALEDSVAAKRFLARTYSGQGSRPGLMKAPLAACIAAEGAILVLEDSTANNRIQAFDLGGNPVRYFTGQSDSYFMYLTATEGSTYLDVAAEFSGFIYVLSRNGSPPVFRLDIYHPSQSDSQPICTTKGMNAARLTVDFWRNVYTLNYEVLKLPSGHHPGITEPSVSFWLPR
ncbi:MAG: hypothetical protein JO210_17145 [Acidobacteriaceae bacterium]|nr:hypothetical protein [Acidobacteriaceae bacterium]